MKGVSPLLAAILLIAIVVTVASLVSGWLTSTIRSSTATAGNKTETGLECSSASISIDRVFVSGTTSATVTASVRNNGQANGLVIQSAQLYNISGSNFTSWSTPITSFDKGDIETLRFSNVSLASCPGAFAELRVNTDCGGISDVFTGQPNCS